MLLKTRFGKFEYYENCFSKSGHKGETLLTSNMSNMSTV